MSNDADIRQTATVRAKNQLTLPAEVRARLLVNEGDEVEFSVNEAGEIVLRGMTRIPTDQRWFWDPEWQHGEAAATAEIAAGDVTTFENADDMFNSLDG